MSLGRLALALCFFLASPAAGEELRLWPTDPFRLLADDDAQNAAETEEEPDPDRTEPFPQITLELSVEGVMNVATNIKKGREGQANSFEPYSDAGLRRDWTYASVVQLDVKMLSWAGIGGFYWRWFDEGNTRATDDDVHMDGVFFPEGTRVRTRLEIQHAEFTLRYVWTHTESIYLWFGIGASWVSYFVAVEGSGLRAAARLQGYWAPAWTYAVRGRLKGWRFGVYLTSSISLSAVRFPSLITHNRLGLDYELTEGLFVSLGLSVHNGILTDLRKSSRDSVTGGYRHEDVSWSVAALELGVTLQY